MGSENIFVSKTTEQCFTLAIKMILLQTEILTNLCCQLNNLYREKKKVDLVLEMLKNE